MQITFLTRGIKHDVDRFINELAAQYWPFKVKNKKTGKTIKNLYVQGNLRPIQLWEYAFPKESMDQVITTLQLDKDPHPKFLKKYLPFLRKILKQKKIPKSRGSEKPRVMHTDNVGVIGIGLRDDEMGTTKHPDWEHERI